MLSEKSWNNKWAIRLLYVIITLIFVSYIPFVYWSSLFDVFSLGIMGVMSVLVILTLFRSNCFKNHFLQVVAIIIALLFIEFGIFYVGHLRYNMDDVRQLVIVFFCMVVGYSINMTEQQLTRTCLFYIIGAIIIGLYAIVFYTGSFSFTGNRNLIAGKNKIGAMVAIGGAIALYLVFSSERKKRLFIVLAVFSFFVAAILRDRSAFVAFIVFSIVLGFKRYKPSRIILIIIAMILLYIFFKSYIDDFFMDSLMGRGEMDMDNLSTGRYKRNEMGIQYLSSHFFEGELYRDSFIPLIHNYLLLRLVRYGIWGVGFIVIYFLFFNKILKEVYRHKSITINYMGFFILIIPFFISLLEPSFPFGPGVVQFFVYFLFGQSLQRKRFDGDKCGIDTVL